MKDTLRIIAGFILACAVCIGIAWVVPVAADSCFMGNAACTGAGTPQACCTGNGIGSCVSGSPCSLPCPSVASTTYQQLLPGRANRTDILVCDLDTVTTLYVVFGIPVGGPTTVTWNYGFPVAAGFCQDFFINPPNPNGQVHTVTSQIGVVTQSSTAACSYFEKAD